MDNYYKSVAEARLKKFYSVYNQAILLAEVKHGPKESWFQDVSGVEFDDEGNAITATNEVDKWFSKYLEDFIVIKKISRNNGQMVYWLNDGSQFTLGSHNTGNLYSTRDIFFFPFGKYESCNNRPNPNGSCIFNFIFCPIHNSTDWKYHYQKGLEPFVYNWDGNNDSLWETSNSLYGCKNSGAGSGAYCTAIIQRNGWKVPKNYPRKIHP